MQFIINLFRNRPYPGWLIIFFIFLFTTIVQYNYEKYNYQPAILSEKFEAEFNKIYNNSLEDWTKNKFGVNVGQVNKYENCKYFVNIYKNDQPLNWNQQYFSLSDININEKESFIKGKVHLSSNFWLYTYVLQYKDVDGVLLDCYVSIPIKFQSKVENDYLPASFYFNNKIPINTTITNTPESNSYAINSTKEGKVFFYLGYNEHFEHFFQVTIKVLLLIACCFYFFLIWFYRFLTDLYKRVGWRKTWMWNSSIIVLFFIYYFFFKLPIGVSNTQLFSPTLVASGWMIRSLGDLMILLMVFLWNLLSISIFFPLKLENEYKKNKFIIILLYLFYILTAFVFIYFIHAFNISKLIIDSKISFNITIINSITPYTFGALFCVILILSNILMLIYLVSILSYKLIKRATYRFLFVILLNTLFYGATILFSKELLIVVIYILSLILYFLIEFSSNLSPSPAFLYNISRTYKKYWILGFSSAYLAIIVFYYNTNKEYALRTAYAEQMNSFQDYLLIFDFEEQSQKLSNDPIISDYILHYKNSNVNNMSQYIYSNYFNNNFLKYINTLYFFDANHKLLNTSDVSLSEISKLDLFSNKQAGLQYLNPTDIYATLYLGKVAIKKGNDVVGYIAINIKDNSINKSKGAYNIIKPRINYIDQQLYNHYNYQIILNNNEFINTDENIEFDNNVVFNPDNPLKWENSLTSSKLIFTPDENSIITVIYDRNILLEIISLFSVIIILELILMFFAQITNVLFISNFPLINVKQYFTASLGIRMNLIIMSILSIAFFVIGVITINFLIQRYNNSKQKELASKLHYIGKAMNRYMIEYLSVHKDEEVIDYLASYSFKKTLEDIGMLNDCDINIYDRQGHLVKFTQQAMFQAGFISNIINPNALDYLRLNKNKELILNENIGNIEYRSAYITILDANKKIVGYCNVPYYNTKEELQNEISDISVGLINVYIILFLLTGIVSLYISASITRSVKLLIEQFRKVNLKDNALVEWKGKDEIGMLVFEYNKMIKKVEKMAKRLARSERESAWRDVAKQVAHEIKNPLTPMKLNLQYLQSAIKSDRDDIPQLTQRISVSLLEQIDHLTKIATEFSNFAKMPDAHKEVINLPEALNILYDLFKVEEGITLIIAKIDNVDIFMDKSYFIRVFTNLITNAIQAKTDDRACIITLSTNIEDNHVIIEVKDNGKGIDKETADKLFTPYFTTKSSGTGIGLFMCKSIIEQSNGEIWYETILEEGTSFFVCLPIHKEA